MGYQRQKRYLREQAETETEADLYQLEQEAQEARKAHYRKNPSTSGGNFEPPEDPPASGVEGTFAYDEAREWIESGNFAHIKNSSNVYAIAYDKRQRVIYVQYYHWEPGMAIGERNGPGAIYKYSEQSEADAMSFYRAVSAGVWVWDNLRVRGTWSQHQCPYELAKIGNDYLPRKSVSQSGEDWWVPRRLQDNQKQVVKSQLLKKKPKPPRHYEELRRRYENGTRNQGLNATPSRGNPSRGNRNRPDNGSPKR